MTADEKNQNVGKKYMCCCKTVLIRNIKIAVTPEKDEGYDEMAFRKAKKAVKKSGISAAIDVNSAFVYKKSVDARNKNNIFFIYTVAYNLTCDVPDFSDKNIGVSVIEPEIPQFLTNKSLSARPVVVGFGPCGMFCALALAKAGLKPIVIERGEQIDVRTKKVARYWEDGILDTETNVQFGEGGAGTFSDGKLLTRISDKLCRYVLHEFVKHGAPEEILYLAKPHIGTDRLRSVVKSIRKEITELGGDVIFNAKLTDIEKRSDGTVTAVFVNDNEKISCGAVFLCIGHSARDTVKKLMCRDVDVKPKPFSVGVRIEHLQSDIDTALYGNYAGLKCLGASSYTLSARCGERTVYSFCMCPGGVVVASASDNGQIVTNGMSNYARDGVNANSAIAVSVNENDFGGTVDGAIAFQENIERKAFSVGGNDGTAPIQLLGDFLSDSVKSEPNRILPTYTGRTAVRNAKDVFPRFVSEKLALGIRLFDREINGFCCEDAVLTFPETRTSSPVKIPRNGGFVAEGFANLYPLGEGAGYAGGITSAAVDGLRGALEFLKS